MTIPFYEGFDYGGDIAEKETYFKVWPTNGNRICLVDADLLPYRVGFVVDEVKYLQAQRLVADGHCDHIRETPQYESAFESLCMNLNSWVRQTGCDAAILYTTHSDSNFRLDIAFTDNYKGQRSGDKPPFFNELKDDLEKRLGGTLARGIEADDMLSITATRLTKEQGFIAGTPEHKELCNFVVASSDKDSTITCGFNWNPDTKRMRWVDKMGCLEPKYVNKMVTAYEYVGTGVFWKKGEKAGQEKTKRVKSGEKPSSALKDLKGSGLMFFYAQLIMGDAADNYRGLFGIGKTGAYELLRNCKTEKDLYLAVLGKYKDVYGSGVHWCPHYKGTDEYYKEYVEAKGEPPEDFALWKGRGAYLTAHQRMLEQGRLAWMMQYEGDIWRKDKSPIIDPHDLTFWRLQDDFD